MIEIPQPSIALNSHDVPGTKYEMTDTWDVPATETARSILRKTAVLSICAAADGLKCLIINSHGRYGKGINSDGSTKLISTGGFGLSLGMGITLGNVNEFSQLRGMVKCIIIVACGAAYTTIAGTNGDGALLCGEIAKASGAYVIAPKTVQIERIIKMPKNHIDNFEGVVCRYNPAGSLDDSGLLGRKLINDLF